jgi:hypothetical protein
LREVYEYVSMLRTYLLTLNLISLTQLLSTMVGLLAAKTFSVEGVVTVVCPEIHMET